MLGAIGWEDVLQVVAVFGGLTAVATFVAARLDTGRAQAAGIYVLVTGYRYGAPSEDEPGNFTNYQIVNDSELPALDVGLSAWQFGERRRLWRFHSHNDWMTSERITGRLFPTVLPRSRTDEDDIWPPDMPDRQPPGSSLRPPLVLTFRDGRGRRWVRWPDGKLSRRWPSR